MGISDIYGWGPGMTSSPGHPQLQHRERQQHAPPQLQQYSPHHQFYQSGFSSDFDGGSPTRGEKSNQPWGTPQKGVGEGNGRRESDTQEWGLTKAGKKRQRLPLACQVCRKKKVMLHMNSFNMDDLDSMFRGATHLQALSSIFTVMRL